jgi:hypothetical protein
VFHFFLDILALCYDISPQQFSDPIFLLRKVKQKRSRWKMEMGHAPLVAGALPQKMEKADEVGEAW